MSRHLLHERRTHIAYHRTLVSTGIGAGTIIEDAWFESQSTGSQYDRLKAYLAAGLTPFVQFAHIQIVDSLEAVHIQSLRLLERIVVA